MKTFTIISDFAGNDSFEIEAETREEAGHKALQVLGWDVYESPEAA